MMFLETAVQETAQVAYGNINLVTGCIIVIVALSSAVVYLYKRTESLQKEFRDELKASNATLMDMSKSYHQFVNQMSILVDMKNKK